MAILFRELPEFGRGNDFILNWHLLIVVFAARRVPGPPASFVLGSYNWTGWLYHLVVKAIELNVHGYVYAILKAYRSLCGLAKSVEYAVCYQTVVYFHCCFSFRQRCVCRPVVSVGFFFNFILLSLGRYDGYRAVYSRAVYNSLQQFCKLNSSSSFLALCVDGYSFPAWFFTGVFSLHASSCLSYREIKTPKDFIRASLYRFFSFSFSTETRLFKI